MPPKSKLSGGEIDMLQALDRRRRGLAGRRGCREAGGQDGLVELSSRSEAERQGTGAEPIDAFIRAKLAEKGLAPSPRADARTLIRRLYFDLTGLPPTPEEVEAFVADSDPQAYEKLVDRLLASPRYGERWARHWLDVVHYGETHGYDKDKPRPNAWPYRDYVIRAFNDDKPYARFVQEQIAGDVLYPGTTRRHRGARFPRRRAVGSHRARGGAGDEDRRQDRAAPRPRRHGAEHDRHLLQPHRAVRAVPQSQVRSDLAGGLLHAAGRLRRARSHRRGLRPRRRLDAEVRGAAEAARSSSPDEIAALGGALEEKGGRSLRRAQPAHRRRRREDGAESERQARVRLPQRHRADGRTP